MPQDRQSQQAMPAEFGWKEFAWEPGVTATNIDVTPREGAVTLTGRFARQRAARRVKNVIPQQIGAAAERVKARLSSGIRRRDGQIAAAAVNCPSWDVCLSWGVPVPRGSSKVEVEKVRGHAERAGGLGPPARRRGGEHARPGGYPRRAQRNHVNHKGQRRRPERDQSCAAPVPAPKSG